MLCWRCGKGLTNDYDSDESCTCYKDTALSKKIIKDISK